MKRRSFIKLSAATAAAPALARPLSGARVLQVSRVAPAILSLTIEDGRLVRRPPQRPYVAQPGDEIRHPKGSYLPANTPQLWNAGRFLGWLVDSGKTLTQRDRIVDHLSSTAWLHAPSAYAVSSTTDPRFKRGQRPSAVHRKSIPHSTLEGVAGAPQLQDAAVQHHIYLQFDAPLRNGASYRIAFIADLAPVTVTVSDLLTSEALHASQLGFAPQDEAKVAFMSCWLGSGGALAQPEAPPFLVIDASGQTVFEGRGRITTRAADTDLPPRSRAASPGHLSLSRTDVVMFDFSALRTPGDYRVVVPGIGASHPIRIAEDVWLQGLQTTLRYFYHQRSGIELKPPYTDGFRRPRNLHPADGVKVYASTLTLLESTNGLSARGRPRGDFVALAAGKTEQQLPEAWGGYADSGDWDRRIQHLQASRLKLDLLLEGGERMAALKLAIPESGNGLPDLLNEALWNLDFYRRLMTPEGGVRGGVEAEEHPKSGEGSWIESWEHFAYAPDPWSGYQFAASAARCAFFAQTGWPALAATYRAAALKTMVWSEAELPRWLQGPDAAGLLPHVAGALTEVRNLAAADLLRLTGEARWHEVFRQTLRLDLLWQRSTEALWVYLNIPDHHDKALAVDCRARLLAMADQLLDDQQHTGYQWLTRMGGWGGFQRKYRSEVLLQAWRLTREGRYRRGAILAQQMALGANPNNRTYISGLGHTPMQEVFYLDAKVQGQPTPVGFPAFGPFSPTSDNRTFVAQMARIARHFVPPHTEWPLTEFGIDSGVLNPVDEHLPDLTGWVVYHLGSLAIR